jgi:hypothetical protein
VQAYLAQLTIAERAGSFFDGPTPRAPDRATEFNLSKCSKGTPAKGNGEATPSAGPVSLLVGWRLLRTAFHLPAFVSSNRLPLFFPS